MRLIGITLAAASLFATGPALAQTQGADTEYRPVIDRPAYAEAGPTILLDAAHGSVQTIDGRYAGFAALVRADGYGIREGREAFDAPGALDDVEILVISNVGRPSMNRPPSRRPRSRRCGPGYVRADRFCWRRTMRRTGPRPRRWEQSSGCGWASATPFAYRRTARTP